MENLKHEINTIKFAMDNGFTKVEVHQFENGEVMFHGAFGTIIVNSKDAEVLKALISSYNEVEEVEEVEEENKVLSELNLTENEVAVLNAMYEETFEIGLPVELDDIQKITKFKKRSIVGIIGSLTKKGLVISYSEVDDTCSDYNIPLLTDEGYDLVESWN